MLNIIKTIFVATILTLGTTSMANDHNKMALNDINEMVKKVNKI